MKKILLALLVVCGTTHAAETVTAKVNGMVCAFCAQGIEKKARALPETEDVYVNLKQKIVAVQVREGHTLSPDALKALVRDAGYDVTAIETADETVTAVRVRMEQP